MGSLRSLSQGEQNASQRKKNVSMATTTPSSDNGQVADQLRAASDPQQKIVIRYGHDRQGSQGKPRWDVFGIGKLGQLRLGESGSGSSRQSWYGGASSGLLTPGSQGRTSLGLARFQVAVVAMRGVSWSGQVSWGSRG